MDEIKNIARAKFLPGKREEWKRLTQEAMEIAQTKDPSDEAPDGNRLGDPRVLGMTKATMRENLRGEGGPRLFTPWMTIAEEPAEQKPR